MEKKVQAANRIIAFDIIRIIAALAVIMIHASARFVTDYSVDSTEFILGNIADSISRIGVPLFVMLSGALMLNENKNITYKKVFKSTFNIFAILVIWSGMYAALYNLVFYKKPFDFKYLLRETLFGHYHLWYLYMIIGLYLFTPVLRLVTKRENKNTVVYFLGFAIAVRFCLPFANYLFNRYLGTTNFLSEYISQYRINFIGEYLVYYVLGWYLTNFDINKKIRGIIYLLGFSGLAFTIFSVWFWSEDTSKLYDLFYSNGIINILLYSTAVFVLIFYAFKEKELKCKKFLIAISNLTFGVYLIHIAVLYYPLNVFEKFSSPIIQLLFNFTFTGAVSFVLVYVISKIPFVKKLIKS